MAAYTEQLYEKVLEEAEHKSIEAALEVETLSKDKKLSRMKIQHWNENVKPKTNPRIGDLRARYVEQEDMTRLRNLRTESTARLPTGMAVKRPASIFEVSSAEFDPPFDNTGVESSSNESRLLFPNKSTHLGPSASLKSSTSEEGPSSNTKPPQAMTEAQIEHCKAIQEQTRPLQQQVEDRNFAEETSAEKDIIQSVLRERNRIDPGDDESSHPNLRGVPIWTDFPCPEGDNPMQDENNKKKLAIAYSLPRNLPELYLPGRNVHLTLPPLDPRWKAHYFGDDNHAGDTGTMTEFQNGNSPGESLAAPKSRHHNHSGDRAPTSTSECDPSSSSEDLNKGQLHAFQKLTAPLIPRVSSHHLAKWDQLSRITGQSKIHVFRNEKGPNQKERGVLDHDGTFHPLPPLPSPERLQELEERKRNEPRQFTSPIIDRESDRGTIDREYDGGNINREYNGGSIFDGTCSVARYLDFKVQSKYTLSHKASRNQMGLGETFPSLFGDVSDKTRRNRSRAAAQESHSIEDRAVQKGTNVTSPCKKMKKKPSIFSMKHSMQSNEVIKPVNSFNASTNVRVKKGTALNSLKQSPSFTKLSEKATEPTSTIGAGQGKDDRNVSMLHRPDSQTTLKRSAKESDTVPRKEEICKSSSLKKLFKYFSPSKRSNSCALTAQSHDRSTNDVAATSIRSDRSPFQANQVEDSDTEPCSVPIHEPTKRGNLPERSDNLYGNTNEDCGEIFPESNMDKKKAKDVEASLDSTGSTKTKLSNEPNSSAAEKQYKSPIKSSSGGDPLNESLATAYAGTSHADLYLRDELAVEELEARKLAEVKAMDAECSETDRYMARALGRSKPLPDAALSSNITTAKEKAEARGLGESIQKVHEEKEPLVKKEAEQQNVDKASSNPGSKLTLRARMEKYPS